MYSERRKKKIGPHTWLWQSLLPPDTWTHAHKVSAAYQPKTGGRAKGKEIHLQFMSRSGSKKKRHHNLWRRLLVHLTTFIILHFRQKLSFAPKWHTPHKLLFPFLLEACKVRKIRGADKGTVITPHVLLLAICAVTLPTDTNQAYFLYHFWCTE